MVPTQNSVAPNGPRRISLTDLGQEVEIGAIPDSRESLASLAVLVTAGDVELDRARRLL
jgi:hypothetical protein